jgi:hypothetical protein
MTRGWNAWQNAGLPSIPSVFALVSSGSVGSRPGTPASKQRRRKFELSRVEISRHRAPLLASSQAGFPLLD